MSEEDADDKPHDPSQRRLEEARKRGELPRSTDLTAAASYAGLLLAAMILGPTVLQQAGAAGLALLDRPDLMAPQFLQGGKAPLGGTLAAFARALAPFFALPMAAVLLALIGQRAFVFAPEKLAPRLSRISPRALAGQRFGREGLFEFGKSLVKMLAVALILGLHLTRRAPDIIASLGLPPAQGTGLMLQIVVEFLFLVVLLSAVTGAGDYLWQKAQHLRRNRMSRKDLMDEIKDSEGDPHVKGQRRQRAQEIALNRMLTDVAKADVVIVNPTHYAVALRWKRSDRSAPICVAKGVDEVAARIRERAALAGVPLHSDPPTARAIHAVVKLGEPIRPEHYRPVAAAIRFAEALKKRRKGAR